MAKSRAQRKAEKRKREAQAPRSEGELRSESSAQHATQVPESGEVAEVEAIIATGAQPEELGETVRAAKAEPEAEPELESPAPSRADVGVPDAGAAEPTESRRERKRREREEAAAKEARRKAREKKPVADVEERKRGAVLSFLISCWAELKRVQWPDRETLIQASAITIIFVAVAAAYLGVLDAIFNWLVQRII